MTMKVSKEELGNILHTVCPRDCCFVYSNALQCPTSFPLTALLNSASAVANIK